MNASVAAARRGSRRRRSPSSAAAPTGPIRPTEKAAASTTFSSRFRPLPVAEVVCAVHGHARRLGSRAAGRQDDGCLAPSRLRLWEQKEAPPWEGRVPFLGSNPCVRLPRPLPARRPLHRAQSPGVDAPAAQRDPAVVETVSRMLADIERRGIDAVSEYAEALDRLGAAPIELARGRDRVERRAARPPPCVRRSSSGPRGPSAFARVTRDHLADFETETVPGLVTGVRYVPVGRVGAYLPAGRFPLTASAFMTVGVAKAAGVPRSLACTPPQPDGGAERRGAVRRRRLRRRPGVRRSAASRRSPRWRSACSTTRPSTCSSARATPTSPRRSASCSARVGDRPARRAVGGRGPRRRDRRPGARRRRPARPGRARPGLARRARHHLRASSGERCVAEVDRQLADARDGGHRRRAWRDYGSVIVAADRETAAALMDDLAPEHLEVITADDDWYHRRLTQLRLAVPRPVSVVLAPPSSTAARRGPARPPTGPPRSGWPEPDTSRPASSSAAASTAAANARSIRRGPRARPPASPASAAEARAMASSASAAEAWVSVVTGSSVAGLSTVNVDMRHYPRSQRHFHRRSKPRRSSQSVTAASIGGQFDPGACWRSAPPPPRRTPPGPARSSPTASSASRRVCGTRAASCRRRRCPSARGSSGSSLSMPCRPAAIIAATARYGFTSPPGTRFSTRSEGPCPTSAQRAGAVVRDPSAPRSARSCPARSACRS